MSSFQTCREIEKQSVEKLLPMIQGRFDQLIEITEKVQQEFLGDYIGIKNNKAYLIEFKCEEKHTGNFYFETWSNYDINPGWFEKCKADYLIYHFRNPEKVYVLEYQKAKKHVKENKHTYREVKQKKHTQKNHSLGLLVPVDDLKDYIIKI
jgi:hypothetical protein